MSLSRARKEHLLAELTEQIDGLVHLRHGVALYDGDDADECSSLQELTVVLEDGMRSIVTIVRELGPPVREVD
jgi:hypothetical protein